VLSKGFKKILLKMHFKQQCLVLRGCATHELGWPIYKKYKDGKGFLFVKIHFTRVLQNISMVQKKGFFVSILNSFLLKENTFCPF